MKIMLSVDATKVAELAHLLWMTCGEPTGRDEEFWFGATRILTDDHHEENDIMSVQVRRRREAAAFLQSFVGAQGELLVDTTNNRVQVHDGVTPGGWAAAGIGDLAGRNAIINGNFAINQRGYASGGALAAGAYAHDRWKAGTAGAYTFSQSNPDTMVTIASGTLVQAIDVGNVYATGMWLTWTGTAQARVWQGAASGAFSAGTAISVGGVKVNALLVTGLALGTVTNVEFATGTLGLVQFEAALPNAGPTRFERRHGEMTLCQRYLEYISNLIYCTYAPNASAHFYYSIPMKVNKRATPTVTLTNISASGFTTTPGLNAVSSDQVIVDLLTNASGGGLYQQFSVKMEAEI